MMYASLIGLCIVTLSFSRDTVRLHWFDSVAVNDSIIYLKNIARITSTDPELVVRIGNISAGEAAPPGAARFVVTSDCVTYRLKEYLKYAEFIEDKKCRVKVTTIGREKKISDFREEVLAQLQGMIAWNPGDWQLIIENEHASFTCYDAPLSVQIQKLTTPFPRGAVRLEFIARQGGRAFRIPIVGRIDVVTSVLVTSRTIERGAAILPTDCEVMKKDISHLGPTPFFTVEELIGKKAVRTIPAGTIMHKQLVTAIPDVQKGDNISLTISKGTIRITVMAVARENGFKGQKIWAQNTATNKLVRVIVTDEKTAQLL